MKRRLLVLCLAFLVAVVVLPVSGAAAEDVPDMWTGVGNGVAVFGLAGGQLNVPYVAAHVAQAQVDCQLVIYTMRGPAETIVKTVPMGTVTAVSNYFCSAPTGELPFTFIWDNVTLPVGSYQCRVEAFDGTTWSARNLTCPLQIMSAPDTTPPLDTTPNYNGSWVRKSFDLTFTVVDDPDGWGGDGGLAHTDYSLDGGASWKRAGWAEFRVWKRGGGSGVYTMLLRGTDAAGNEEATTHSCQVFIDARAPITTTDAPQQPQSGDVTVHFAALDNMSGVTACSGVAATWYSVDGGRWLTGSQVTVPAARNAGTHWIAYYSTDVAGNVEYVKWCSVTISAPVAAHRVLRLGLQRSL